MSQIVWDKVNRQEKMWLGIVTLDYTNPLAM
jgi:hypothetical protein